MDDERRWNSAPQYEKTVEDSNVPPSYAHYHMHQGTTTQNSETSDKRVTPKEETTEQTGCYDRTCSCIRIGSRSCFSGCEYGVIDILWCR